MTSEETYSINGAAELTGYSLPTIRKRLDSLKKHGAIQVQGRWQIPLSALHQTGLMQRVTSNPDREAVVSALQAATITEVEALRVELAETRQRAAIAEALADERQRAIERLDRTMLALEQRITTPAPTVVEMPSQQTSQQPRRSWLERLRGD
jgi:DeoR/GlpR family transcriptional regulator of sugar metabolism